MTNTTYLWWSGDDSLEFHQNGIGEDWGIGEVWENMWN